MKVRIMLRAISYSYSFIITYTRANCKSTARIFFARRVLFLENDTVSLKLGVFGFYEPKKVNFIKKPPFFYLNRRTFVKIKVL